jgi:hypothetical protein
MELRGQTVGFERSVQRHGRQFTGRPSWRWPGNTAAGDPSTAPCGRDAFDATGKDRRWRARRVAAQHAAPRLVQIEVRKRVQRGVEQIDDALTVMIARRAVLRRLTRSLPGRSARRSSELTDDRRCLALAPRHADVHRRVRIADGTTAMPLSGRGLVSGMPMQT